MDFNTDGLLEEEFEIINVFNCEIKEHGYNGYCSFYDEIPNGYFIYKDDDGNWEYHFNEKGKTKEKKKYTNIYNLCLDILVKLKINPFYYSGNSLIIPRGTKVIITRSSDCPIDEIHEGIITGNEIIHSQNAKPERIYHVIGNDNEEYTGLYGFKVYGDICFRTLEDYIRDTKIQIDENKAMIQELHEINWDLFLAFTDVINRKDKYLQEDSNFKKK